MQQALQFQIRGLDASPALEAVVRAKADKLDRASLGLKACLVVVEQLRGSQGGAIAVRIDVTLPGYELSVVRVRRDDVYLALRDAFDDMEYRLEDDVRHLPAVQHLAAGGYPVKRPPQPSAGPA